MRFILLGSVAGQNGSKAFGMVLIVDAVINFFSFLFFFRKAYTHLVRLCCNKFIQYDQLLSLSIQYDNMRTSRIIRLTKVLKKMILFLS